MNLLPTLYWRESISQVHRTECQPDFFSGIKQAWEDSQIVIGCLLSTRSTYTHPRSDPYLFSRMSTDRLSTVLRRHWTEHPSSRSAVSIASVTDGRSTVHDGAYTL